MESIEPMNVSTPITAPSEPLWSKIVSRFHAASKPKYTDNPVKKFVCVIGAGSSGLAATKSLVEEGHSVICYEQYDHIGGNWAYSEETGRSSIYESSIIFTTKENMCYSDFPMSPELPHYLHHSDVLHYLNSYTQHFNLKNYIQFNTKVLSCVPQENGTWSVTTEKSDGSKQTILFDAVLVCNGHHRIPKWASFEGSEEFQSGGGMILHSHCYNKARPFAGKRVVVVGVGNSGCDLAVEISKVATETYISTRHGVYVIPKFYWGIPTDHLFLTRFFDSLPSFAGKLLFRFCTWFIQGNMSSYGLDPKIKKSTHPTRNSEILPLIKSGHLKVKGNIRKLERNQVIFEDGSRVECDVVIYATGYRISFPFLENVFPVTKSNDVRLFKYVVSTDPKLKNLFFIGLVQPLGALMPISELQSRWVSRVLSGHVTLPSPAEMDFDIQYKRHQNTKIYHKSTRHTIQVNYISFMDELADLIGARPSIWKRPSLILPLVFGVVSPVQYRLDGPGKMKSAEEVVKNLFWYSKPVPPVSCGWEMKKNSQIVFFPKCEM